MPPPLRNRSPRAASAARKTRSSPRRVVHVFAAASCLGLLAGNFVTEETHCAQGFPPPKYPLVRYHGVLAPNAKVRSTVVPKRERPVTAAMTGGVKPLAQCAPAGSAARQAANDDVGIAGRDHLSPAACKSAIAPGSGTSERQTRTSPLQLARNTDQTPRDPGGRRPDRRRMERINWADLLRRVYGVDALRCPKCSGRLSFVAVVTERAAIARILNHLGESPSGPPPVRTVDPWAA